MRRFLSIIISTCLLLMFSLNSFAAEYQVNVKLIDTSFNYAKANDPTTSAFTADETAHGGTNTTYSTAAGSYVKEENGNKYFVFNTNLYVNVNNINEKVGDNQYLIFEKRFLSYPSELPAGMTETASKTTWRERLMFQDVGGVAAGQKLFWFNINYANTIHNGQDAAALYTFAPSTWYYIRVVSDLTKANTDNTKVTLYIGESLDNMTNVLTRSANQSAWDITKSPQSLRMQSDSKPEGTNTALENAIDDVKLYLASEMPYPASIDIYGEDVATIPEQGVREISYTADVYDQFDRLMPSREILWSVDGSGLSIDAAGKLSIPASAQSGSYNITATSAADQSVTESFPVEIEYASLNSVKIEGKSNFTIHPQNRAVEYSAKPLDQCGYAMSGEIIWSMAESYPGVSLNNGVVTIQPQTQPGNFTISARLSADASIFDTLTITLEAPVISGISISGANEVVSKPDTASEYNYTASLKDQNGDDIPLADGIIWGVSEGGGKVSILNGKLTVEPKTPAGAIKIFAAYKHNNAVKNELAVSIIREVVKESKIEITGSASLMIPSNNIPQTYKYTADVYDQYGEKMQGVAVSWGGSASVNEDGVVTVTSSSAAGSYTVTASVKNGVTATLAISIFSRSTDIITGSGGGAYRAPSGGGAYSPPVNDTAPSGNTDNTSENPITGEFSDVSAQHWGYSAISKLSAMGVINGIGDDKFEPRGNLTRGQFVKIIILAFGFNAEETNGEGFWDISQSDWFYNYAVKAKELGIVSGYEDLSFRADNTISREEMAVMLSRAAIAANIQINGNNTVELNDWKDVADFALEAVELMARAGIITGDNGNIYPKNNASRAEAAVMIYRIIN